MVFHYSIEPMIDPGDENFYRPFLKAKLGQKVKKGEVLGWMYTPPRPETDLRTHIHFNLMAKSQFIAPTIFTKERNRPAVSPQRKCHHPLAIGTDVTQQCETLHTSDLAVDRSLGMLEAVIGAAHTLVSHQRTQSPSDSTTRCATCQQ